MSITNGAAMLPVEILAEIFTICLPPTDTPPVHIVDDPHRLSAAKGPLLVASVCHRWRKVALATPHLWKSLDFRYYTKPAAEDQAQVVSSWLSRSEPYPVSFTAVPSSPGVVKEVIRQCERWNAVELVVSEDNHFLNEVRGRLPCLTKLFLCIDPAHFVEAFADAPKLTHVSLLATHPSARPMIVLPWHQLTSLHCDGFGSAASVDMLRQCPALVDFRFQFLDTGLLMEPSTLTPVVVHDRVTSFKISTILIPLVLQRLTLPSLRSLHCEIVHFINGLDMFLPFLDRSRCQLEILRLHYTSSADLLHCVPRLAALTTLEIHTHGEFLTDEFLHWFTQDSAAFPNLRTLDLELALDYIFYEEAPCWEDRRMREMILSRCLGSGIPRNVCIQTFRLLYSPDNVGNYTGLTKLATELTPLLKPCMVEFTLRPDC
ncbi:hypothetical protein C8R46DRAFT_383373 [Mycena filopes]|nr:hypothetical protein C8R46DRAFT_383373 [Mycena filopes]